MSLNESWWNGFQYSCIAIVTTSRGAGAWSYFHQHQSSPGCSGNPRAIPWGWRPGGARFAPPLSQLGSNSRQAELRFEGLQIMQRLQTSLLLPFPAGGGSSPEHCAPQPARSSGLSNSSSRFTSHSSRHRRRRGGNNTAKLTKISFKTLP